MFAIGLGYIRRTDHGVPMDIAGVRRQLPTFVYAGNDAAAAFEGAGFLNALVAKMPIGTKIEARLDLDGTPALKDYIVSANDGTVVTITASAGGG